jgi:hypothetical protein
VGDFVGLDVCVLDFAGLDGGKVKVLHAVGEHARADVGGDPVRFEEHDEGVVLRETEHMLEAVDGVGYGGFDDGECVFEAPKVEVEQLHRSPGAAQDQILDVFERSIARGAALGLKNGLNAAHATGVEAVDEQRSNRLHVNWASAHAVGQSRDFPARRRVHRDAETPTATQIARRHRTQEHAERKPLASVQRVHPQVAHVPRPLRPLRTPPVRRQTPQHTAPCPHHHPQLVSILRCFILEMHCLILVKGWWNDAQTHVHGGGHASEEAKVPPAVVDSKLFPVVCVTRRQERVELGGLLFEFVQL